MDNQSYQLRKERNSAKKCSYPGCFKNRSGLSRYCAVHHRRHQIYGHPEGKPMNRDMYRHTVEEAYQIIKQNRFKPIIQEALIFLENWKESAVDNTKQTIGKKYLIAIHDKGIDAEDMLAEIAGVAMYLFEHPSMIPDLRAENVLLGRCIIRMVWGTGDYKGYEAKRIGEYLRSTLGLLLVKMYRARLKKRQEEIRKFEQRKNEQEINDENNYQL